MRGPWPLPDGWPVLRPSDCGRSSPRIQRESAREGELAAPMVFSAGSFLLQDILPLDDCPAGSPRRAGSRNLESGGSADPAGRGTQFVIRSEGGSLGTPCVPWALF